MKNLTSQDSNKLPIKGRKWEWVERIANKIPGGKLLLQFIKFGMVGVVNTAVDFGIFYLLAEQLIYRLPTPGADAGAAVAFVYTYFDYIAQTISFGAAVLVSYFLNKHWTFGARNQKNKSAIAKMYALNILGYLVLQAMFWFWRDIAGVEHKLLAKLFASLPVIVMNFFGTKFWVFRRGKG